jgi:KDO2-lipid IV(A) lauroyltransferase
MVTISVLRLSLALFQFAGIFFGLIAYFFSANYRNKTIDNYNLFCQSESIEFKYLDCILNSIEVGKTVSEQLLFLFLTKKSIVKLIKTVKGIECIDNIDLSKKNIIFITPHFGCFEIIPLYLSSINPICVMYKKSKIKVVELLFK